ncbi:MAG: Asp-tRNA(Asn)/Glu-tRNA(Gln) amidotransferase subunit GatB [Patescibacteria group bacterium]
MSKYEVVVGIEVHLQLKTASKMYCACRNEDNATPNVNICPICTGQPGTLPVLNQKAVELVGILSIALEAEILQESVFARKNYFYPDLPKGYQISQYELPFSKDGKAEIETRALHKKVIRIERLQLEEDSAKMMHAVDGSSLVDFNRAGAPLVEIVSLTDIRSAEEAKLYVLQLQSIARFCGVSDADMEKGQMRCDVNVSIRPVGDTKLYTKIEVKNLNSVRAVERTIEFELNRQASLWEAGTPPTKSETRGWNDASGETVAQRTKEGAADYRYFNEPDIPPLRITPEQVAHWRAEVPELPAVRQQRLMSEYELSKHDAGVLVGDARIAEFFETTMSELRAWLNSIESTEGNEEEIWKVNRLKLVRGAFGWITGDLFKLLNRQGKTLADLKITPENFAELLILVFDKKLNRTAAAQVLEMMLEKQHVPNGSDPSMIMQNLGVEQQHDTGALSAAVDTVLNEHPSVAADVRGGKDQAVMFLVGKVMKLTKGSANPEKVAELIRDRIGLI